MDIHAFFVGVGIILLICIAPMLLCLVLCACGFTTAGVAAKSYAAGLQSVIGNVVKGSWFAVSQSIMASRLLFNWAGLAIVIAAATIALSVYYFCVYEGEYSAANITSSVGSTLQTWEATISNASDVATSSIVDAFDHLKTSVENVNITDTIADSFENVKSSISDANITSSIGNIFDDVKDRMSNANITSEISNTFDDIRKSISDANITAEITETFENVKNSVWNANITSSVSDAFENVKDSISNANITSYVSGSIHQWFSSSGGSVTIFNWKIILPLFSTIFLNIYL